MKKVIDTLRLELIDRNDDFVELLFGRDAFNREVKEVSDTKYVIECDGGLYEFYAHGGIRYTEDNAVKPIKDVFQIVRYIDNYLNSLSNAVDARSK